MVTPIEIMFTKGSTRCRLWIQHHPREPIQDNGFQINIGKTKFGSPHIYKHFHKQGKKSNDVLREPMLHIT